MTGNERVIQVHETIDDTPFVCASKSMIIYAGDYGLLDPAPVALVGRRDAEKICSILKSEQGDDFRVLDEDTVRHEPIFPNDYYSDMRHVIYDVQADEVIALVREQSIARSIVYGLQKQDVIATLSTWQTEICYDGFEASEQAYLNGCRQALRNYKIYDTVKV